MGYRNKMVNDDPRKKIFVIFSACGVPALCSVSDRPLHGREDLHLKILDRSREMAKRGHISRLKALKIQIRKSGFIPEVLKNDNNNLCGKYRGTD